MIFEFLQPFSHVLIIGGAVVLVFAAGYVWAWVCHIVEKLSNGQ